jgi:hypothetical protein
MKTKRENVGTRWNSEERKEQRTRDRYEININ